MSNFALVSEWVKRATNVHSGLDTIEKDKLHQLTLQLDVSFSNEMYERRKKTIADTKLEIAYKLAQATDLKEFMRLHAILELK